MENAEDVVIERVSVLGAHLDGINVRMSEVTIRDCSVSMVGNEFGQGIDISFTAHLEPSLVENCLLTGGQEGIFLDSVHAMAIDNHVRQTTPWHHRDRNGHGHGGGEQGRGRRRDRHSLQRLLDVRYPGGIRSPGFDEITNPLTACARAMGSCPITSRTPT